MHLLILMLLVAEPDVPTTTTDTVKEIATAAAWAIPTFELHIVIHEGSHALMAMANGATGAPWFRPYPVLSDPYGYIFGWAGISYPNRETEERLHNIMSVAPVLTEIPWLFAAAVLHREVKNPYWRGIFLAEMVASFIDLCQWWKSSFSPYGDAHSMRDVVIPVGVIVLPILAITAGIVAFSH